MQECITVDEVRAMKIGIYAVCTAFVALHSGVVAHAMTLNETSALCETAARDAADHYAIPPQILHTLALTESGRTIDGRLRPWPWAINQSGESSWFGSQAEMLAAANALVSSGIVNFDIGCFQLNYRWHAQHFSSVADMADPGQNALMPRLSCGQNSGKRGHGNQRSGRIIRRQRPRHISILRGSNPFSTDGLAR